MSAPPRLDGEPRSLTAVWRRRLPRFVTQRPYSLEDVITYDLEGAFTAEDSGSPRRWGHIVVTLVFTIPLYTLGYWLVWLGERPIGRLFPVVFIWMVTASGLNELPAVAGLVPDWWTLPYWFAGWWTS